MRPHGGGTEVVHPTAKREDLTLQKQLNLLSPCAPLQSHKQHFHSETPSDDGLIKDNAAFTADGPRTVCPTSASFISKCNSTLKLLNSVRKTLKIV